MSANAALFVEAMKFVHLVGLCVGLGGAIFADLIAVRLLFGTDRPVLIPILKRLHQLIGWGLGAVWLSGIAIVAIKFDMADIPNKVFVKYVLASALTINAIAIGRIVIPHIEAARAPLAISLPLDRLALVAVIGATSFVGWSATLLVAKFTALQAMPIIEVLSYSVVAWAAALAGLSMLLSLFRYVPALRPAFRMMPRNKPGRTKQKQRRLKRRRARRLEPLADPFAEIEREWEARQGPSAPPDAGDPEPQPVRRDVVERLRRFAEVGGRNPRPAGAMPDDGFLASLETGHEPPSPEAQGPAPRTRPPRQSPSMLSMKSGLRVLTGNPDDPEPDGARTRGKPKRKRNRRKTAEKPHIVEEPAAPKDAATTPQAEPAPTVRSALASCRRAFWGVVRISFVTNLLMLTGPLFMLQIYDRVLTSQSVPTLGALLAIVACLFLFIGLLETIRSRVLVRIGARLDRILRERVFDSVMRVAPASAPRTRFVVLQDLERVRQFVASPGPVAAFDLPWAPVYLAVIFLFHPMLGFVALAGTAVLIVLSLMNQSMSHGAVAKTGKLSEKSLALAEAGGRNAESLHAMGMTDAHRSRWLHEHQENVATQTHLGDVTGTFYVASRVFRLFLQSLILAAGAYLAIHEAITPGVMIAASIILSRALSPVEQVIGQWRGFVAARQGLTRIAAFLKTLPDNAPRTRLPDPQGHLTVETLYAAPLGAREPVLKDLNFALQPGDALGVIGPSASGKSTLARALVGVWPPMRGAVRLDGAAMHQWPPDQLGQHIGYLAQEVELFDGTIAENIARFDPHRSEEALFTAARTAGVHDLVLGLPDGYNTRIGTGGLALSGGQRQRIALARAIYRKPALIVLDEPNANLDSDGDVALARAIVALREAGRTIVVISHKESVLSAVSHLLVLKDGRQARFGPVRDILSEHFARPKPRTRKSNVTQLKKAPPVAAS